MQRCASTASCRIVKLCLHCKATAVPARTTRKVAWKAPAWRRSGVTSAARIVPSSTCRLLFAGVIFHRQPRTAQQVAPHGQCAWCIQPCRPVHTCSVCGCTAQQARNKQRSKQCCRTEHRRCQLHLQRLRLHKAACQQGAVAVRQHIHAAAGQAVVGRHIGLATLLHSGSTTLTCSWVVGGRERSESNSDQAVRQPFLCCWQANIEKLFDTCSMELSKSTGAPLPPIPAAAPNNKPAPAHRKARESMDWEFSR